MKRVKKRTEYTYRCKICGFECVKEKMPQSSLNVTKLGDYGDNATPTPTTHSDEVYSATTIGFVAETASDPAYLTDSNYGFADNHVKPSCPITIETTSGTNDGSYTTAARGVSRGTLTLSSTDSLTTESAATAGTVTISRTIYEPNITTGCAVCGSLASR